MSIGAATSLPRARISVLIAAHNAEPTLGRTLESLQAQTASDWQVIVVDDGSTDKTADVADSLSQRDSRIHVLHQCNTGAAAARNAAARAAVADWLLPLDADDLLEADALETLAAFIHEHPGYDLYSVGVTLLLPDGTRKPWRVSRLHDKQESFTLDQLIEENLLTVTTAISSRLFREIGGFRDLYMEDYDLWLRALASGARHLHCPEYLFVYRVSGASKNANVAPRADSAAKVLADISDDFRVPRAMQRKAAQKSRYFHALALRSDLERRLTARSFTGARTDYWRARNAYLSPLKWFAGLLVMIVSPRLFAKLPAASPSESFNV